MIFNRWIFSVDLKTSQFQTTKIGRLLRDAELWLVKSADFYEMQSCDWSATFAFCWIEMSWKDAEINRL